MAILSTSFCIDLLILIALLLAVAIITMKYTFTYWKRKGIFTLPPSIPFGNAANLVLQKKFVGCEFKDVYDIFKQKGLKYGGYYFLAKPIFVPVDLDLIKRIMTQDFAHFTDHVHYINGKAEPLTADLSSLKGWKWKQLRSKLTPAFTSGKMRMMFQTLLDCTQQLIDLVNDAAENDETIDVKDAISRFNTDVFGSCAFGLDCNSLKDPNSEFRRYGQKFLYTSLWYSIIKLMLLLYPEILFYVNVRTLGKDVHDFFMNVVNQTVRFREENNIIRKDLMHILIQLKNNVTIREDEEGELTDENNKNATSITIEELAAQCFFFFIAGFETSSTASTFLLYELAQNIDVQEKLRREIKTVLTKYEGELTYDAIMEMPYMDKCINEALRKYPPIAVHTRECTKTYKVPNSDVILEKGTAVFIPVLGIHNDADYYPNPEIFDPERFSDENKAARHPSAWSAFGDGPRSCIGMRFGIMQTKVGVIALLKNHKFTLSSKTQTPLTMNPSIPFVLSAENGIWLNATRVDQLSNK